MRVRRERGALAITVALVLVADLIALLFTGHHRGAARQASTSTSSPASTSSTSTTSTTEPGPIVGAFPLTGLPARSVARLHRPALSIKIDNAPDARPQAGLSHADIVTEELVEGGLTRFLATYQSQDAGTVGPIRSARPVDAFLLDEVGGGLFAYSGAATAVIGRIKADSGAVLISPDFGAGGFDRVASRPSPANLYSSTPVLYAEGAQLGRRLPSAPALFTFSADRPAAGVNVATATLSFSSSSTAVWTWEPTSATFHRAQDGVGASDADGGALVTAENVVVLSVATRPSGDFDVRGNQNPESVVIGSGPCWVLRNGVVVTGSWTRATAQARWTLTGADGQVMTLQPGRTWLELLPEPFRPVFA